MRELHCKYFCQQPELHFSLDFTFGGSVGQICQVWKLQVSTKTRCSLQTSFSAHVIAKAPCHLATCAQVKTAVLRVISVGSKEEDSKCLSKTLDNGQNAWGIKRWWRLPCAMFQLDFLRVFPPEISRKGTKLRFQRQAFSHAPIPALQLPLSIS